MVNHSRQSFRAGEVVYHSRLGEGTILDEWGSWIDLDERGNELPVNGAGIYEVEFKTGRTLSVNRCWLALGSRAARSQAKPVWQLTS
jgi:hypothetical protein